MARTATASARGRTPKGGLTIAERAAQGRAARRKVPRSSQAIFAPDGRRDPIAVLERQAATRVPELVPIRNGRMLSSPLAFYRGAAAIERMNPKGLAAYGRPCGWTLARAHARSGDRHALAAYVGDRPVLDRAVLEFSESYAEQNQHDYEALAAAVKDGRIVAEPGL